MKCVKRNRTETLQSVPVQVVASIRGPFSFAAESLGFCAKAVKNYHKLTFVGLLEEFGGIVVRSSSVPTIRAMRRILMDLCACQPAARFCTCQVDPFGSGAFCALFGACQILTSLNVKPAPPTLARSKSSLTKTGSNTSLSLWTLGSEFGVLRLSSKYSTWCLYLPFSVFL